MVACMLAGVEKNEHIHLVGKLRVFSYFLQTTSFFLLENSRMIIIIHDVIEGWPTHNGKHEAILVL